MEDNFVDICENYKELCSFFSKNYNQMSCAVCRFLSGEHDSIISNTDNKKYKVYKFKKENEYEQNRNIK